MIRVGHDVKRKILPGPEGVRVLALGGVPGAAFEADPSTEVASLDAQ
jgi:hypothetical protein